MFSCGKSADKRKEPEISFYYVRPSVSDVNLNESVLSFSAGICYSFCDKTGYRSDYPAFYDECLFADSAAISDMTGAHFDFSKVYDEPDDLCIRVASVDGKVYIPVKWFAVQAGLNLIESDDGMKMIISGKDNPVSEEKKSEVLKMIDDYENIVCDLSDVECGRTGVGKYKKTPKEKRLVGIAYTTWMRPGFPRWGKGSWDIPILGTYNSDDREIIKAHGEMLRDAGIDFVFVDWTNNTCYDPVTMRDAHPDFRMIEEATDVLFEVWSEIQGAPKICIFAGPGHSGPENVENGNHQKKVDQIYRDYVDGKYKDMYFYYEGKPLLMCYGATPHLYGVEPDWTDDRFTIRWVTGYVGQQSQLFDQKTKRSYGFWSWEERGEQTYTVEDGYVECITCTASSRAQGEEGKEGYIPAYGRDNGQTFKKQFQRANDLGAKMIIIVSWNEWTTAEQLSPEISKDIEPSQMYGTFYYDLMTMQIKKFKGLI